MNKKWTSKSLMNKLLTLKIEYKKTIGEFPMVLRKKRNTDFCLSIPVNRLKSVLRFYKTLSLI